MVRSGIETLSAALSESRDALEEVIEPFLLQQGLIQRTPRGRMLAQKAWTHLGLAAPKPPGNRICSESDVVPVVLGGQALYASTGEDSSRRRRQT